MDRSGDSTRELGLVKRRRFLEGIVGGVAASPFLDSEFGAARASELRAKQKGVSAVPSAELRAVRGYLSLSIDEAAAVERIVNVMCPADSLTPNGVDCGLAAFIDRQLAGGFGKGEKLYMRGPWRVGKPQQGYQLSLTPEQYFKIGLVGVQEVSTKRYGKVLDSLDDAEVDALLADIAAGKLDGGQVNLAAWFNDLVYPLFNQACFADPIYGGNVEKVFWRMVGFPGLPATYSTDVVTYRGKQHPAARDPKSIQDFA